MDSLYRFYDKDDVLLYAGISIDPFRRFKQHGSAGKNLTLVSTVEIEWFKTREEADMAESIAIRREKPRWNIAQKIKPRVNRKSDLSSKVVVERVVERIPPQNAFIHFSIGRVKGVKETHQLDLSQIELLKKLTRSGDFVHVSEGLELQGSDIEYFDENGIHLIFGTAQRDKPENWNGIKEK